MSDESVEIYVHSDSYQFLLYTCAGYLGHLFTKAESRASTIALISRLAFMKRRTGRKLPRDACMASLPRRKVYFPTS
jgi:hypothetical protein